MRKIAKTATSTAATATTRDNNNMKFVWLFWRLRVQLTGQFPRCVWNKFQKLCAPLYILMMPPKRKRRSRTSKKQKKKKKPNEKRTKNQKWNNFEAAACFGQVIFSLLVASLLAFGLLFGCSVVRRPIINLRQSMTVSGRQKCDAKVCRLLGAIARLSALGLAWPDLTPVASDVTANEQRDKRRDRDSERERETQCGCSKISWLSYTACWLLAYRRVLLR